MFTPSRHESNRVVLAAAAMTIGLLATARSPAAPSASTDSISHAGLPSVFHGANASPSGQPADVAVISPRPPTEQELAGDSLYQFVVNHATTHYVTTSTTRNLARWRGGRQSICPRTAGLDPGSNAFVTARLRAVAEYVGAPVDSNPQCKDNVQILFTNNPKEAMDGVMEWATSISTFGIKYQGGTKDLLAYDSDHAIQGWYLTTRGGATVLNTDLVLVGLDVLPLWPRVQPKYLGVDRSGTRLGGHSGSGIGIGMVILIVDTTGVGGYSTPTIADYLSMLTLSVVQSPDHCDPLPSILDLMSSSCGTRAKLTGLTAGDLAFLKALYYRNTGLGPSLSRAAIKSDMARQFGSH